MKDIDVFNRMNAIQSNVFLQGMSEEDAMRHRTIAAHKTWLGTIRRERPNPETKYSIGVYIRYFNQTKYENYLDFHKQQFRDTINMCPAWTLVDFYIDEGATAPNMESAPELSRLLTDCMDGKIDLIITQKVSNVSKKAQEVTFCARMLAAQQHPVGIYFISEDMFTLASYYQKDLYDDQFLIAPISVNLPGAEEEHKGE